MLYYTVLYMPKFSCKDIGMSCNWRAESKTHDELMTRIKKHAADMHGITEFTPDLLEKVRTAIID